MSKSLLVIDDDEEFLEILAMECEEAGYVVYQAHSGNTGIELLKKHPVDLVISDFEMNDGDGLAVLKYLKSSKHLAPLIMISASTKITPEKALKAGADCFMTKPLLLDALINQVHTLLK